MRYSPGQLLLPLGQQTRISERLIGLALGAGVIGPVAKRYAPNLKNQGYQLARGFDEEGH